MALTDSQIKRRLRHRQTARGKKQQELLHLAISGSEPIEEKPLVEKPRKIPKQNYPKDWQLTESKEYNTKLDEADDLHRMQLHAELDEIEGAIDEYEDELLEVEFEKHVDLAKQVPSENFEEIEIARRAEEAEKNLQEYLAEQRRSRMHAEVRYEAVVNARFEIDWSSSKDHRVVKSSAYTLEDLSLPVTPSRHFKR